MNAYDFAHQIDAVRHRADVLGNQAKISPLPSSEILHQCLEELNTALEELHVAEEELRQQNEELATARQAMELERQRYQELFEFAPDGYLVTDPQGKIQEANRAAARLLCTSQKFLKGKLLINFIPENERRAFRSRLLRLHEMEQIQDWEVRMQTREGIRFDAAISVTMVRDNEGNLNGWRWLVRNITARKQAEAQMHAIRLENLQLQEASRMKSQFLAVMSHELRTPMNAILGFSQLLLRLPYHQFPPQARNMVERIFNSAKRLLALIEDILDFSKLESGRLELRLQEFNLAELVTATTEELRCLAEQKHLTLYIYINLSNPNIINDSDRVRQILVNLLSNAIKFTDIGGVSVEVMEIQDRIMLIVKDTGIGIAKADLKKIFQEFRQVNQCLTRKQGGTGLGLAIVDQLVHLMKGNITVESKLGEGSTFRVELPRIVSS
ncbi:PAS domain-containing sensor histidine kinase [Fischerella sp. PCC 9605]|uniref:PAS domain-containing sensor histidine kinase n=1 Tax=Fischerella sp. PCC 9605 TaxID=1173024 RepID=UPI00047B4D96|nr:PAS domain-containing protein [Fischerella sp. PCC 9605]